MMLEYINRCKRARIEKERLSIPLPNETQLSPREQSRSAITYQAFNVVVQHLLLEHDLGWKPIFLIEEAQALRQNLSHFIGGPTAVYRSDSRNETQKATDFEIFEKSFDRGLDGIESRTSIMANLITAETELLRLLARIQFGNDQEDTPFEEKEQRYTSIVTAIQNCYQPMSWNVKYALILNSLELHDLYLSLFDTVTKWIHSQQIRHSLSHSVIVYQLLAWQWCKDKLEVIEMGLLTFTTLTAFIPSKLLDPGMYGCRYEEILPRLLKMLNECQELQTTLQSLSTIFTTLSSSLIALTNQIQRLFISSSRTLLHGVSPVHTIRYYWKHCWKNIISAMNDLYVFTSKDHINEQDAWCIEITSVEELESIYSQKEITWKYTILRNTLHCLTNYSHSNNNKTAKSLRDTWTTINTLLDMKMRLLLSPLPRYTALVGDTGMTLSTEVDVMYNQLLQICGYRYNQARAHLCSNNAHSSYVDNVVSAMIEVTDYYANIVLGNVVWLIHWFVQIYDNTICSDVYILCEEPYIIANQVTTLFQSFIQRCFHMIETSGDSIVWNRVYFKSTECTLLQYYSLWKPFNCGNTSLTTLHCHIDDGMMLQIEMQLLKPILEEIQCFFEWNNNEVEDDSIRMISTTSSYHKYIQQLLIDHSEILQLLSKARNIECADTRNALLEQYCYQTIGYHCITEIYDDARWTLHYDMFSQESYDEQPNIITIANTKTEEIHNLWNKLNSLNSMEFLNSDSAGDKQLPKRIIELEKHWIQCTLLKYSSNINVLISETTSHSALKDTRECVEILSCLETTGKFILSIISNIAYSDSLCTMFRSIHNLLDSNNTIDSSVDKTIEGFSNFDILELFMFYIEREAQAMIMRIEMIKIDCRNRSSPLPLSRSQFLNQLFPRLRFIHDRLVIIDKMVGNSIIKFIKRYTKGKANHRSMLKWMQSNSLYVKGCKYKTNDNLDQVLSWIDSLEEDKVKIHELFANLGDEWENDRKRLMLEEVINKCDSVSNPVWRLLFGCR